MSLTLAFCGGAAGNRTRRINRLDLRRRRILRRETTRNNAKRPADTPDGVDGINTINGVYLLDEEPLLLRAASEWAMTSRTPLAATRCQSLAATRFKRAIGRSDRDVGGPCELFGIWHLWIDANANLTYSGATRRGPLDPISKTSSGAWRILRTVRDANSARRSVVGRRFRGDGWLAQRVEADAGDFRRPSFLPISPMIAAA
jgi:hypothetical protein